jgi:hypothetical protein
MRKKIFLTLILGCAFILCACSKTSLPDTVLVKNVPINNIEQSKTLISRALNDKYDYDFEIVELEYQEGSLYSTGSYVGKAYPNGCESQVFDVELNVDGDTYIGDNYHQWIYSDDIKEEYQELLEENSDLDISYNDISYEVCKHSHISFQEYKEDQDVEVFCTIDFSNYDLEDAADRYMSFLESLKTHGFIGRITIKYGDYLDNTTPIWYKADVLKVLEELSKKNN